MNKLKILVVDDEPMIVELLVEVLKLCGHVVFTANSRLSALEALRNNADIDLGITDQNMDRELNGGTMLAKEARKFHSARFWMITGRPSHEAHDLAKEAGIEKVITKPLYVDRLQADVQELADSLQHTETVAA